MKILLTGAGGQLGRDILARAASFEFRVEGLARKDLNIADEGRVSDILSAGKPYLVINAAAYTRVDQAESEAAQAYAANAAGPAILASACATNDIPLIHISTDYVFDGTHNRPYVETDPVSPIGVYGKSKEQGERAIRKALDRHIIIRTSWLYGVHGPNFVKTMLRLGREKETLRVVNDQHGCPTWTWDLAGAVLEIGAQISNGDDIPWGTYHYCNQGMTDWHAFAEAVFELARPRLPLKVKAVVPIPTEEYPTPARRPLFSVLDCAKIQQNFGVSLKPWRDSLARAIDRLLQQRS